MLGETFRHLQTADIWEVVDVDESAWRAVLRGAGGRISVPLADLYLSGIWRRARCL